MQRWLASLLLCYGLTAYAGAAEPRAAVGDGVFTPNHVAVLDAEEPARPPAPPN